MSYDLLRLSLLFRRFVTAMQNALRRNISTPTPPLPPLALPFQGKNKLLCSFLAKMLQSLTSGFATLHLFLYNTACKIKSPLPFILHFATKFQIDFALAVSKRPNLFSTSSFVSSCYLQEMVPLSSLTKLPLLLLLFPRDSTFRVLLSLLLLFTRDGTSCP